MQKHSDAVDVGIGIKMIDARSVERAGAANDPVDFVALLQQQIGQITTVLAGDAGDECFFHVQRLALARIGERRKQLQAPKLRCYSSTLLRRRHHDSRQNSALAADQCADAFASDRKHFIQL